MKTREELYKTNGYWEIKVATEIHQVLDSYMEREGINQTQLAARLGFSKGYITQILNGEANFSMKKLIDLALKIGMVPDIRLKSVEEYTQINESRLEKTYSQIKYDAVLPEDGLPFDWNELDFEDGSSKYSLAA